MPFPNDKSFLLFLPVSFRLLISLLLILIFLILHFDTLDGFDPGFSLSFMLFLWIVNPGKLNFQAVCKHPSPHLITFLVLVLFQHDSINLGASDHALAWIFSLDLLILNGREPRWSLLHLAVVYLILYLKLVLLNHFLLSFASILYSVHPFLKYAC